MADDDTSTEETGTETGETPETTTADPAPPTEKSKSEIPPEVERALRKANKEAETLRLKLKEIEDKDKTEAQRLAEKAQEAEKEASDLRAELLRLKVAAAKGLTAKQAERLRGTDEESLSADADELLAEFKPGRPSGDVDQGHRGGNGPKQVTEAELKSMTPEQIVKAQQEGRLKDLLG